MADGGVGAVIGGRGAAPGGAVAGAAGRFGLVTTVAQQPQRAPRRSASYYVLLGLAALALFAISMFVTILLLEQ
jgi:hypothetical protein